MEATNICGQCTTCRPAPVYTRVHPPGLGLVVFSVGRRKRNVQKQYVTPLTELNKREEDLLSRVEFLSATETLNCVLGEIKFWTLRRKQFLCSDGGPFKSKAMPYVIVSMSDLCENVWK